MSASRRVGLVVLALVLVVVLFWVFVVDWLVEREVETRGTEALRALVDLAEADVSAFPPRVELTGLAVTDPLHPMQNAFEVRRISGEMEAEDLLAMRMVVDELVVEGVRFGTQRTVSGAIPGAPPPVPSPDAFTLPALEIPDVADILANENLASVKLIADLEGEIGSLTSEWNDRLKALPDEAAFDRYREQLEELAGGDPLSIVAKADSLRRDIKRDLKKIKKAGKEFEGKFGDLEQRVAAAKKAPLEDVRGLQERYALSPSGVSNLTASLLGDPVGQLLDQALAWSDRLQAMVGGTGEPTAEPGPDFLIRLARVSIELAQGAVHGTVTDITGNQPAFGKPMTLAFAADAVPGVQEVRVDGVLDRVDPERPADSLNVLVRGYDAAGLTISNSAEWPISVGSGQVAGDVTLALGADGAMTATARLQLSDAQVNAPFPGTTPVARSLAEVVEGIREVVVDVKATGTIADYQLQIESNADQIFADAVGGLLRREGERFSRELREAVLAATEDSLAELGRGQQGLVELESILGDRSDAGQRALDVKLKGLGKKFGIF